MDSAAPDGDHGTGLYVAYCCHTVDQGLLTFSTVGYDRYVGISEVMRTDERWREKKLYIADMQWQ
jgi:hypothetical protein